MSKQKIEKEIVYNGLGFPIVLRNVPMIELRGVWTVDINLSVLQKVVLLSLAHQSVALTGNQVRFIRTWMGLTQTKFANLLGVTHPAVVKWEKSGNNKTHMNLTTQRDLRLCLLAELLTRGEDFRQAFKIVHMTKYTNQIQPLEFDVPTDLVAI